MQHICVRFDHEVRPGLDTRKAVLTTLTNQGIPAEFADLFFDPVTEQLGETDVGIPDSSAPAAVAAINQIAGIMGVVKAVPDPYALIDLTDLTFTSALEASFVQILQLLKKRADGNAGAFPPIYGGARSLDGITNLFFPGFLGGLLDTHPTLAVINQGVADITVTTGSVEFTADGNTFQPTVATPGGIVVKGSATGKTSVTQLYVAANGSFFLHSKRELDATITPNRPYADAVAAGAV